MHPDLKRIVRSRLDRLRPAPFAGKRLERELAGYRSLRARRFRIIYRIDEENGILEIHYVGHRKDVYELLAGCRWNGNRQPLPTLGFFPAPFSAIISAQSWGSPHHPRGRPREKQKSIE